MHSARKAAGKRAASNQLRELAEVADGSVALVVGDVTREQLKLVAARDKVQKQHDKEMAKVCQAANGSKASAKATGPGKKRNSAKVRGTQLRLSQEGTG